jgi:hypothetical protein
MACRLNFKERRFETADENGDFKSPLRDAACAVHSQLRIYRSQ